MAQRHMLDESPRDHFASRLEMACAQDAPGIAALLAAPMPGAVQLALVPSVNSCMPRNEMALRHHALVARGADGNILAHGSRSVRRLWLGGKPRWVGYLGGLRRDTSLAGAGRSLAHGLAQLALTRADDEAEHDFTAILTANHQARRVLEGGLRGAPTYHHIGDFRTWICASKTLASAKPPVGWSIGKLRSDEISTVQRLVDDHARNYALVVCVADAVDDWLVLRRGDQPVGCVRLWDRREDQRVMVVRYAQVLGRLRTLANVALRVTRRPTLPVPGTALELGYLAHWTCPEIDPAIVCALLAAVARLAIERGCDSLAMGLNLKHPCASVVDAFPAWRLNSRLYAVGTRPSLSDFGPSPEVALL